MSKISEISFTESILEDMNEPFNLKLNGSGKKIQGSALYSEYNALPNTQKTELVKDNNQNEKLRDKNEGKNFSVKEELVKII